VANAWIHSKSYAVKFGGEPNDYHMFWVQEVMISLFGYIIVNSEGNI
jgi:hypothetical protein